MKILYLSGGTMKVEINKELCIGCGICEELAPELFQMKGDYPVVLNPPETEELRDKKEYAIIDCPTGAISEIISSPKG